MNLLGGTAKRQFDLVVIGTGSAATTAANQCRAAGWSVAVVDCRPFGGTCALRGCDPKKVLVGAVALIDWVRRMDGKGMRGNNARVEPSRRVGEDCSGFKVLIDESTGRLLGAHVLGPEADELINVFALAIQSQATAEMLQQTIFAYPTHGSDVAYML
jgi:pyruvate/2-oxoglutarate dehydrogenase complex dihydrolipoamide dehydrogenase (E3) component